MFEIAIQDEYHASLLLLDLEFNQVVDIIGFHCWEPPDQLLKSWVSTPRKESPTAFVPRPHSHSWSARGEEKAIRALWDDKGRPMAQRIHDAKIEVTHSQTPEAFNCRAGVIFCLQAMGLVYIPSPAVKRDYGTLCDIKSYNLSI